MPKMKNVAKNEIVLHDPYSNALWGGVGGGGGAITGFGLSPKNTNFLLLP